MRGAFGELMCSVSGVPVVHPSNSYMSSCVSYMGVFTLSTFIKLHTICVFSFLCYTAIKSIL